MTPIDAAQVRELLSMSEAIGIAEKTMIDVSHGKAELPLHNVVPVGGGNMPGIMPGVLTETGLYGVKLLGLFPGNPARGLSSHVRVVVLFDPEIGMPTAIINADYADRNPHLGRQRGCDAGSGPARGVAHDRDQNR